MGYNSVAYITGLSSFV